MKMLPKATMMVAFSLIAPTVVTAQDGGGRGPQPAELAADLGVSVELLESCSPDRGQAGGERPERPSREEHETRMTEMASCLQQGNASITAQSLDQVMQNYRPAAPDRG